MVSFGDIHPADDNALLKAIRLNDQWDLAFAANNLNVIWPIVEEAKKRIDPNVLKDGREIADLFAAAYSNILQKEFFQEHIARFGYHDFAHFRADGHNDLGHHFDDLCIELARYDIGASFLLFGHDTQRKATLFGIEGPGRVIDHNLLQYAVIGSGQAMAMASLRWPPKINFLLGDTLYRALEAKFSAETATGVGRTTTAILRNADGSVQILSREEVEDIRAIWKREVADVPSPAEAIKIIDESSAVKRILHDK